MTRRAAGALFNTLPRGVGVFTINQGSKFVTSFFGSASSSKSKSPSITCLSRSYSSNAKIKSPKINESIKHVTLSDDVCSAAQETAKTVAKSSIAIPSPEFTQFSTSLRERILEDDDLSEAIEAFESGAIHAVALHGYFGKVPVEAKRTNIDVINAIPREGEEASFDYAEAKLNEHLPELVFASALAQGQIKNVDHIASVKSQHPHVDFSGTDLGYEGFFNNAAATKDPSVVYFGGLSDVPYPNISTIFIDTRDIVNRLTEEEIKFLSTRRFRKIHASDGSDGVDVLFSILNNNGDNWSMIWDGLWEKKSALKVFYGSQDYADALFKKINAITAYLTAKNVIASIDLDTSNRVLFRNFNLHLGNLLHGRVVTESIKDAEKEDPSSEMFDFLAASHSQKSSAREIVRVAFEPENSKQEVFEKEDKNPKKKVEAQAAKKVLEGGKSNSTQTKS